MRWNPDLSCLFGRTLSHDFLPNLFSLRGREIFLVDLRTLSFCSPVEFLHFISLGRDCLFLRHATRARHRFSEQKLRLSIFFSVPVTFPRTRRNCERTKIFCNLISYVVMCVLMVLFPFFLSFFLKYRICPNVTYYLTRVIEISLRMRFKINLNIIKYLKYFKLIYKILWIFSFCFDK